MISTEHYFDWAATSPCDGQILRTALEESIEHWGNPSSIHEAGVDAKKALEKYRKTVATSLGVDSKTIFFTSGGTESDHIPLLSMLSKPGKGSVVVSAIEHPALREMSRMIQNCGWKTITVAPDKNGFIQPDSIASAIQDDTAMVTVMAVNNETGAIQAVKEISDAIKNSRAGKRRPLFHVDCVQAAGKIPLKLSDWGVDSAAFSAHKIGGPRGIGVLYLSRQIDSFLRGGGQEGGIRSGTENLFGAAAVSMCMEKYLIRSSNPESEKRFDTQKKWTESFIKAISEIKGCTLIPNCRSSDDFAEKFSPWVVQAAFKGIPGQVMERALSTEGFYISTGSACSSGRHSRPVLDSMNISPGEKESAVRFSFGWGTTESAMQELVARIKKIVGQFNG